MKIWKEVANTSDRSMLAKGPATATLNICPLLSTEKLTGTGFAQPKCALSGRIIVPIILICARGFKFNYVWANVDDFNDYAVGVKLVTGDYDGNRNVDFRDFSHFALNWQDVNCPYSDWCNGADLDFSTVVDFND